MNFEQYDIDNSNAYLLALQENGTLKISVDKLEKFIDFITNNLTTDLFNETLLLTIKTLSIARLKDLEEKFIKEVDFDEVISKSFQLEKRRLLKQKLIQFDSEIEEVLIEEIIAKAFRTEQRQELKQRLQNLEKESKPPKTPVIPIKYYLNVIGVAASLVLIFLFWQPQHSSDKTIFESYSNNINKSSISDFARTELIKEQNGLRGEEEHFKNYTHNETLQLLEAISLVKQKDFETAKEIFYSLQVKREKNPGLALYLGIVEVNTGKLDAAINNLEYLAQLHGFLYLDEAKFHLAFAYLKSGDRKKAKELLNDLINSKSKFSDQAQQTLKKIRWF